jgi:hypothetical protein
LEDANIMGGFMSAQEPQPDLTPVAGTQVKSAGTDESTACSNVPPETNELTTRAGEQPEPNGSMATTKSARVGPLLHDILHGLIRAPGVFAVGFRGATWDHKADKEIRDDLKLFDKMRSLPDADKQRLKRRIEELLDSQRGFLRSAAAVEAIANRVTWVLCICAVAVPAVVAGLISSKYVIPGWGEIVSGYFFALVVLPLVAFLPVRVLEMLTGHFRAGMIWMVLVLWVFIAVAAWIVAASGTSVASSYICLGVSRNCYSTSNEYGTILVAVVCAVTALTIVLVARVYIVAWNKNALTNAWAEQRLEAAVVWLLLRVVHVLEEKPGEHGSPTLLQRSGAARAILAVAAEAVIDYLPRLISGGSAYSADAQRIANEGAAALLDLRSAVNLPCGRVGEEDLAPLTKTIEKWSIGSLADIPRKVPLTADSLEPSSRRSGLLQVLRKLLLGALPLILLIAVTLLPFKISADFTAALAPFAVTWLLLSVASVFAPDDVKLDTKTLFNR